MLVVGAGCMEKPGGDGKAAASGAMSQSFNSPGLVTRESPEEGAPAPSQELLNRRPMPYTLPPCVDPGASSSGVPPSVLAGKRDIENRYSSAVLVEADAHPSGEEARRCSGVVLAPRLILTAAQCVCGRRTNPVGPEEGGSVIDGAACAESAEVTAAFHAPRTPGKPSTTLYSSARGRVQVHPDFKMVLDAQGRVTSNRADLAVIFLDAALDDTSPPIPLAQSEVEPGEHITMVNHGHDFICAGVNEDRRFKQTRVVRGLPGDEGRVLFEQEDRQRYRGQSGGPCLRETPRGPALVGISGQGLGKEPTFTSTHAYQGWIREQLQASK